VNKEDLAIISNARKGSREAFAILVHNYKDFIYRTAYGIVQTHMDAEDVVQETFVKAFLNISQLKDERAFPSWLTTIATRISLELVKKRNGKTVPYETEGHSFPPLRGDSHNADLRIALLQELSKLGVEHRTVLVLREIHGFDYQEIAEILDIPIGTVRSRLHTARAKMRKALFESKEEEASHEL
jgi:RNA polymerase sigma-70 factor, ECF subfamily